MGIRPAFENMALKGDCDSGMCRSQRSAGDTLFLNQVKGKGSWSQKLFLEQSVVESLYYRTDLLGQQ